MGPHKEGKKSKAICSDCKKVVSTTFETRSLDGKRGNFCSQSLLVSVCDSCNKIVALPHQSIQDILSNKKIFTALTRKLK